MPLWAVEYNLAHTVLHTHDLPCHLPISTVMASVNVAQRRWSLSKFPSSFSLNLVLIHLPWCDLPVETNETVTITSTKWHALGPLQLVHMSLREQLHETKCETCQLTETKIRAQFYEHPRVCVDIYLYWPICFPLVNVLVSAWWVNIWGNSPWECSRMACSVFNQDNI